MHVLWTRYVVRLSREAVALLVMAPEQVAFAVDCAASDAIPSLEAELEQQLCLFVVGDAEFSSRYSYGIISEQKWRPSWSNTKTEEASGWTTCPARQMVSFGVRAHLRANAGPGTNGEVATALRQSKSEQRSEESWMSSLQRGKRSTYARTRLWTRSSNTSTARASTTRSLG